MISGDEYAQDDLDDTWLVERAARRYYVELPAQQLQARSCAIERLIALAFDNLGAQHLEVRVTEAPSHLPAE